MIRSAPRRGVQNKDWFSEKRQKKKNKQTKNKVRTRARDKVRLAEGNLVMTLKTLSYMAQQITYS